MKVFVCAFFAICGSVLGAPSSKPFLRRGLNKIVGGTDASFGEFPYQLSLQDISFGYPFHFCGASIYNEHWAITAAHCINGENLDNPNYLQVTAGELNVYIDEGTEQQSVLSRIIQHEDYNEFTNTHDIALLKLSTPLVFGSHVAAVTLPQRNHNTPEGAPCTVTGWGTTSEGGNVPSVLQKATLPALSHSHCKDFYGGQDIDDTMMCAGYAEGGQDACQGDSGGPLYCEEVLAGIVSWGYGCARPNYPRVYTKVSEFTRWIGNNVS